MSDWTTTYASAGSPFSYNAQDDQLAGLSPFGKRLGQGMFKGMSGAGAAMMGGGGGAQSPFQMGAMGLAGGLAAGLKDGQSGVTAPGAGTAPQGGGEQMNLLKMLGLA